jgi:hypothetical protein
VCEHGEKSQRGTNGGWTKCASRLRVERRWDMESEKHSDSEVEHGNDLCSMHKGLAHLDKLGGRILRTTCAGGFWCGMGITNCLAWGTSWQRVCVWCVKGTDWMKRRGSSHFDCAQWTIYSLWNYWLYPILPQSKMKEVAFSMGLKNCDQDRSLSDLAGEPKHKQRWHPGWLSENESESGNEARNTSGREWGTSFRKHHVGVWGGRELRLTTMDEQAKKTREQPHWRILRQRLRNDRCKGASTLLSNPLRRGEHFVYPCSYVFLKLWSQGGRPIFLF